MKPRSSIIILWLLTVPLLGRDEVFETVHVLILSGQNNHNWEETTPYLAGLLEETGFIEVSTLLNPQSLTAQHLTGVDVILSEWNAYPSNGQLPPVTSWSPEARQAYTDFVRQGGGHISIHAGGSSFPNWEDYHAINLMRWEDGVTHHGPIHDFVVHPAGTHHPVMTGIPYFNHVDELWESPKVHPEAEILAHSPSPAGTMEPAMVAGHFGNGRCFATTLGHDLVALSNPTLQEILIQAVIWTSRYPHIEKDRDYLSLTVGNQPLWTLHHDPAEGKPYFHPLTAMDGTTFTDLRPQDHPWHRALWFSWKRINGINYWEEDRDTGKPRGGYTRLVSTRHQTLPSGELRIIQHLEYAPGPTADPILLETRTIVLRAPQPSELYTIDWSATFTAMESEVVLDRTPIVGQEHGTIWGGYAGLSIRLNQEMVKGTFLGSEGMEGTQGHGKPAAWVCFQAPAGPSLLFMDHPSNPRFPSKWYINQEMPYFSPAVIFDGPLTLLRGEFLKLRYRVIVSSEKLDAESAAQLWQVWQSGP